MNHTDFLRARAWIFRTMSLAAITAIAAGSPVMAAKKVTTRPGQVLPAVSAPVSTGAATAPVNPSSILRGDLNSDRRVDMEDVKHFLATIILGSVAPANSPADMNSDRMLNQTDLTLLIRAAAAAPVAAPAPAPSDSTPPSSRSGGPGASNSTPNALVRSPAAFSARAVPGNMVELIDTTSNVGVIRPNQQALWSPDPRRPNANAAAPSIAVVPKAGGFDVVYTFENRTSAPAPLGRLAVGGFRLGNRVQLRDFRFDGKSSDIDNNGQPYFLGGSVYPRDTYSPVMVFANEQYQVGVSLQYPIMDYKHEVFMRLETPGGHFMRDGANWQVLMDLNPQQVTGSVFSAAGDLRPGERRTYTMSVRVTGSGQDWIDTIAPYKEFFASRYGGVRYQRDLRPVSAVPLAQAHLISASNPYGFDMPTLRPDQRGFGPWADELLRVNQRGWSRIMLWAPTGLYKNNRDNNYPFQFASFWNQGAQHNHRMGDAGTQLRRVANAPGVSFGLWWGRAAQVMTSWDTPNAEVLNPDNPAHVAAAQRELDAAMQTGVKEIGLDTLTLMHGWDAYRWLDMLRQRAPGVKFVVEPACPDFLHTLGARFIQGNRPQSEARFALGESQRIADYLLPGHETWAFVRSDYLRGLRGPNSMPTPADIEQEAMRFVAMGYTPCVTTTTQISEALRNPQPAQQAR
ncbi:MAG: hypothetical protein AB7G17_10975 [Phycisphaerales bacterium]